MTPSRHGGIPPLLAGLAGLMAAGLVIDKAAGILRPTPKVGQWRTMDGFETYREAYEAAMATMPQPTRTHDIATDHGTARVYEWVAAAPDSTATPVVLLPGIRSGTPMWAENLPHWLGPRTIYAMDAIGDCGMSTQSVPFRSFADRGDWIDQAIDGLGHEHVHTVGHSFGGAIAAVHALRHPGRLASLTLLEPVIVLQQLPAATYLWATTLMLPAPQAWKDRALAAIGGVTVEEVRERTPVSVMIDAGAQHYDATTVVPRRLSDRDWRSMELPIRVDIASDRSLAGGADAADRARRLGVGQVTTWPHTTHSLPMQVAEQLGPELEQYWGRHDR